MKFPDLPLGQRFQFQDEFYVKIGPLTARRERDGESRMLPRSALVVLASAASTVEPAASEGPPWLLAALGEYERTLRQSLSGQPWVEGEGAGVLEDALATGRLAFLAAVAGRA